MPNDVSAIVQKGTKADFFKLCIKDKAQREVMPYTKQWLPHPSTNFEVEDQIVSPQLLNNSVSKLNHSS